MLCSFKYPKTKSYKFLKVSKMIRDQLTDRAKKFNLLLDDVSITHVAFSPEFTHAVEAKQVAQQTAFRAAYLVDQAVQEKQVSVLMVVVFTLAIDYFSPSLYELREKQRVPSSLENHSGRPKVFLNSVAWRQHARLQPRLHNPRTRLCLTLKVCFSMVSVT